MTTPFLRTFGAGPVPVFALHCSLAHSGAWAGVAQYLDPVVTLKAMDLPGHGQSPMPARPEATADEAVDWALQTLETPCHLFGHSFGAYIALRVALEAPERVLSLSLYEPVFFAAAKDANPSAFAQNLDEMKAMNDLAQGGDWLAAARAFTEIWGDGRPWEMLPDRMKTAMAAGMPMVLGANQALLEDTANVLPRLGRLTMPVLIADGALSHRVIKPVQDGLAARIPGARRETLEGAGHMGVIANPDRVAEVFGEGILRKA